MARRCFLLVGAGAAVALVVATAASAHGTLTPSTAEAGDSQRFELTVPNDRQDAEIVAVALQLPPGTAIESAEARQPLWTVSSDESAVTWRGGPINRGSGETFALTVRLPSDTRSAEFTLLERYDDGDAAPFPIAVSLTGGAKAEGTDPLAVVAVIVAVLALIVATAALALALRPRNPPPDRSSMG